MSVTITGVTDNEDVVTITGGELLSAPLAAPPSDPIGRYVYNESLGSNLITDSSVNSNDMTVIGTEDKRKNPFNDYSVFAASNGDGSYKKDSVTLPGVEDSLEFSISLWVYVDDWDTQLSGWIFNKEINTTWTRGINVRYDSNNKNIHLELQSDEVNQWPTCKMGVVGIIPEKTLTNVIFTWKRGAIDSTDFKIYVNLSSQSFTFETGNYSSSFSLDEVSATLSVGSNKTLTSAWRGGVYDLLLYDRELNSTEREVVYNGGAAKVELNDVDITDQVTSWGESSIVMEGLNLPSNCDLKITNNKGVSNTFIRNNALLIESEWILRVESYSEYVSTIERTKLSITTDNTDVSVYRYTILNTFGDQQKMDYIIHEPTQSVAVIYFNEFWIPEGFKNDIDGLDSSDILSIDELCRGQRIIPLEITKISTGNRKRVDILCVELVGKYTEIKTQTFSFYKDGTGDYCMSVVDFKNIPVGTIVKYSGSTPPTGWIDADGAVLLQVDHPDLYTVLDASGVNFTVPNEGAGYIIYSGS